MRTVLLSGTPNQRWLENPIIVWPPATPNLLSKVSLPFNAQFFGARASAEAVVQFKLCVWWNNQQCNQAAVKRDYITRLEESERDRKREVDWDLDRDLDSDVDCSCNMCRHMLWTIPKQNSIWLWQLSHRFLALGPKQNVYSKHWLVKAAPPTQAERQGD